MTGSTTRERDSTWAKGERRQEGRRASRWVVASAVGGATAVLLLAGLSLLAMPAAAATPSTSITGTFVVTSYTVISSHTGGGNVTFTRAELTVQFNGTLSGNCTGDQTVSGHRNLNGSSYSGSCTFIGSVDGVAGSLLFQYEANDVRNNQQGITGQFTLHGLSGALSSLQGKGTFSDVTGTYGGSVQFE